MRNYTGIDRLMLRMSRSGDLTVFAKDGHSCHQQQTNAYGQLIPTSRNLNISVSQLLKYKDHQTGGLL